MADFTRAELQAQIDGILIENGTNAITATMLNALVSNLLANLTHQTEGDKEVKSAGVDCLDPAVGYQVNGVKVVGAQQNVIPIISAGEIDLINIGIDSAVTLIVGKLNAILTALQTHGLIGPEL